MTARTSCSTKTPQIQLMEDAVTSTPPSPGRAAAAGPAIRLDSPWRTMFGLAILWGSLSLIFWAQRLDPYSRIESPNALHSAQAAALTPGAGMLLLPYEINMPRTSPRDGLAQIALNLDLQCSSEEMEKLLAAEPRNLVCSGLPLFKAIHRLIADREVGYAVEGKRIRLFYQKLQAQDPQKKNLAWEAETELSDKPIAFFPSGDSNRWFTLQMIRDVNQADDPWRLAQVELWNGAEKETTARLELDRDGLAILSAMSSRENISFQIKRVSPTPEARTPGRRHLIFNYQAFD